LIPTGGKGFGKSSDPKKEAFKKSMDKLSKVDAEKKIWIGGLSDKVTWKMLEKHMQEITGTKPKITEVMKKGKACCAFADADAAQAALASANGSELDGQAIEVDVWTEKEKKERAEKPKKVSKFAKSSAAKSSGDDKDAVNAVDASSKVWVGGLSPKATTAKLKKHFADNGSEAHLCRLLKPGTACVTFETDDAASSAIASVNGTKLDGKELEVDVWTKTEKKAKKAKGE